jgi:hypothetical protein
MSIPRALTIKPGAKLDLVETPIFSETETWKAIAPSPARASIDPRHGHLQQFGNFLHAKERTPWLRNLPEFFCSGHRVGVRNLRSALPPGIANESLKKLRSAGFSL